MDIFSYSVSKGIALIVPEFPSHEPSFIKSKDHLCLGQIKKRSPSLHAYFKSAP